MSNFYTLKMARYDEKYQDHDSKSVKFSAPEFLTNLSGIILVIFHRLWPFQPFYTLQMTIKR